MKILVIGSGAREHAIVWKLRQSAAVEKVWCAPGNGGISDDVEVFRSICLMCEPQQSLQNVCKPI
jgi:phosphoribosylamine-glycine ligase